MSTPDVQRRNWRSEVIPPGEMLTEDIRAELRHDLSVYEQVQHPSSKAAMAARITSLVEEMDSRVAREAVSTHSERTA